MNRVSPLAGLQRLVWALALIASLLAFFYLFENWRGQRAWRRFTQELEMRGERLDWQAFALPPVPDGDNFMATPVLVGIAYKDATDPDLISQLESTLLYNYSFDASRWKSGKPVDLQACQQFLEGAEPPTPSVSRQSPAEVVLKALADLEPIFLELRQASQRRFAQFRGEMSPDGPVPNGAGLRTLAYLLTLRTSAELALGKTNEAFSDAWVIQRLAQALQREPFLVGTMSGCAILGNMGLQTFWEGLAAGAWSSEHLRQFQAAFASSDLLAHYDRAMRGGERAGLDYLVQQQASTDLSSVLGSGTTGAGLQQFAERCYYRSWPRGWLYQNQVFHHRLLQATAYSVYDVRAHRVYPRKMAEAAGKFQRALVSWSPFTHLAGVGIPNFNRALQTVARIQADVDQAALACALELYRRAHGTYPASLAALVPAFAEKLPSDVISGDPLKYRLLDPQKYLLYGVGWDETDDGGDADAAPLGAARGAAGSEGDWVWPGSQ